MKSVLKASVSFVGLVALAAPVFAQDTSSKAEFVLEEILVTAQKREATLLDTPVAVSAIGGSVIERAQIRDLRDIVTLVPSLIVNQRAAASNTSFSLRGVGSSTFNFGLEPAVGVFVDGVYRSRNGASINDFLGLERVEVLRGPQSTLFGKNTTAGVINFITKKPEFDAGLEAEISYGNYDAKVAKAGITGPLIEDTLAYRLDVNFNDRDGFLEDVVFNRDINNRDRYGLRGQLLYTPNEDWEVRVIADYNDIDENCCAAPFFLLTPESQQVLNGLGAITFDPVDPFNHLTAVDGRVRSAVENYGASVQIDGQFDGFTLTSITAYREYDELQDIDPDFSSLDVNTRRLINQSYETFTQEIRLTSTTDGPVDWLVGAYYFNQDLQATNSTVQGTAIRPFADGLSFSPDILALDPFFPGAETNGSALSLIENVLGLPRGTFLAPGSGQPFSVFDQTNESFALFGQVDWHIDDRWTLTAGLRYTNEDKGFDTDINIDDPFGALDLQQAAIDVGTAIGTQQGILLGQANGVPAGALTDPTLNPFLLPAIDATIAAFTPGFLQLGAFQFFPPAANVSDNLSDDEFTGNLILSFQATDDLNLYGSYSRGYKAGGFALDSAAVRVGDFQFDAETARSFEFGAKARLLDGRASVNIAIFDQKVSDFQANTFTGSSFVPNNAGSIEIQGLEFDGALQVSQALNLTAAFTWLWKSEYGEYDNGPCPVVDTTNCTFINVPGSGALVPVQNLAGASLSEQPEFRGNITANYVRPISDDLEFFMRTEVSFNTSQILAESQDQRQRQGAYALVGASLGIGSIDGRWSVQLWGRNILDEEYVVDTFESTLPGNLNAYIGDPMTYGITLRTKF